ncbi:hypothetical protein JCM17380_24670 [Desulfosporosinus burensis]
MNDITLIFKDVENALYHCLQDSGNKVDQYWLEDYRRNRAEDARYTFKIQSNLLEELGIIYVKYRNKLFKCIRYWREEEGQNIQYFTVELSS